MSSLPRLAITARSAITEWRRPFAFPATGVAAVAHQRGKMLATPDDGATIIARIMRRELC
jgi:hypothetical protein